MLKVISAVVDWNDNREEHEGRKALSSIPKAT